MTYLEERRSWKASGKAELRLSDCASHWLTWGNGRWLLYGLGLKPLSLNQPDTQPDTLDIGKGSSYSRFSEIKLVWHLLNVSPHTHFFFNKSHNNDSGILCCHRRESRKIPFLGKAHRFILYGINWSSMGELRTAGAQAERAEASFHPLPKDKRWESATTSSRYSSQI